MIELSADRPCPCGSDYPLGACCGPLLDGAQAASTAESLMRSRYSAFCLGAAQYLLQTWHPATRPDAVHLDPGVHWTGLQIVATAAGAATDREGVVEFIAAFLTAGRPGRLHERSQFVRVGGLWFYLKGDIEPNPTGVPKSGRNAPCPCGSGRKYKRCCGQ